jgi:hypothetical protein
MEPEPRPSFTEVHTAYKTVMRAEFVGVMNRTFLNLHWHCFI